MSSGGFPVTEPFVLLDDSLTPDGRALLFEKPLEILTCASPAELETILARIEARSAEGRYLAGFLSYELGYLFEPRLKHRLVDRDPRALPLVWMAVFETPRELTSRQVAAMSKDSGPDFEFTPPELTLSRDDYIEKVRQVRDYIAAGDVYQINLTFKYRFMFSGNPIALYGKLRRKQPVSHGALIHVPGDRNKAFDLLSLSPELFFRRDGDQLSTRPMKGTAARGLDLEGDGERAAWLQGDPKSRAENLMIVDLLRNDLGRVSDIGSVRVSDLFTVETYRTVLQMTSGITARLRPATRFHDILRNIFPCGSITGAPKVRAMEIIHELEHEARGVYTGAIGVIAPGGDCRFNVAIRTLMIGPETKDGSRPGEMGIGSGIVFDSDPTEEYGECLLKGRFLTAEMEDFQLIETLLWQAGSGFSLYARHLRRLENSARYFGFRFDREVTASALESAVAPLSTGSHRIRLLLDRDGEVSANGTAIAPPDPTQRLVFAISERRVDSRDPFFRHKTTRRRLYDSEFTRLGAALGCDEVLFLNERGEVAEGSRTNVFIERDGRLYTPPLDSGALPGTLRQELLENPDIAIEEAVLTPAELEAADRVLLGNSVRGLLDAEPVRIRELPRVLNRQQR